MYILPLSIALLAQIAVALGALAFLGSNSAFKRRAPYFLCFSAGTFLGLAFFDLLPEVFEMLDAHTASLWILAGFLLFFGLSSVLHWYHHHDAPCDDDHNHGTSGTLVTIGDFLHNFFDGIIIAVAFVTDIHLGIITTIAVTLHEIPQEISDFAVLLSAGWSRTKALFANGLVALGSIIGAIVGIVFSAQTETITAPLIGIAAGNFLYIAASDLLPRFNIGTSINNSTKEKIVRIAAFAVGIGTMFVLSLFGGHEH